MASAIPKSQTYYAPDRADWRRWLAENHLSSPGIWLVYFKKNSGKTRVAYDEAVEEALCFGWIDSTLNPIDEDSFMQLFTPRKEKSAWSKLNKQRVEQLTAAGLMMPAGIAKVQAAQQSGTWHHLDHVEAFSIPPELEAAFQIHPNCRAFYDTLSNMNKKYILYRLHNAKRRETKQIRIEEIITAFKQSKLPDRYLPEARKKGKE